VTKSVIIIGPRFALWICRTQGRRAEHSTVKFGLHVARTNFIYHIITGLPIPMVTRSQSYAYGCCHAGIASSNPTAGMYVCFVVCVVAKGRSLGQRSRTDCVVTEYNLET
jgi:hypothetical protein